MTGKCSTLWETGAVRGAGLGGSDRSTNLHGRHQPLPTFPRSLANVSTRSRFRSAPLASACTHNPSHHLLGGHSLQVPWGLHHRCGLPELRESHNPVDPCPKNLQGKRSRSENNLRRVGLLSSSQVRIPVTDWSLDPVATATSQHLSLTKASLSPRMFVTALVMIATTREKPKCPSAHRRVCAKLIRTGSLVYT